MRKTCITLAAIIAAAFSCHAAQPPERKILNKVRFGVEWGYDQHFYTSHHYNIINTEGNRINGGFEGIDFCPAGNILTGVSYDAGRHLSLSLHTGFTGATSKDRYIPFILRFSYFYKDTADRGTFTFIHGGTGLRIPTGNIGNMCVLGGLGQGYRVPLAPGVNLDMSMALQFTLDSPPIPNPDGHGYVSERNIRKNDARYYALSISVGLNF